MSITDELRKWCENRAFLGNGWQELHNIADRIDAEHERRCKEQYACGAEDGISASIEALVIQTHGFIELPKDADGEYIRIGDVMEWIDLEGKVSVTCVVEAVGVDAFIAWDKANGRYAQKCATAYRHYHAPTVEDVLREFANEVYADADNDIRDRDFLCAKYAKRLKLAGDAE